MSDMFTFDDSMEEYPFIQTGGLYGPGQQFEAEVQLSKFVFPAEGNDAPGFDKDCSKDTYGKFIFTITLPDGDRITTSEHHGMAPKSGSKLIKWVKASGTPCSSEDGRTSFNPDDVAPRDLGALRIADPRQDKVDHDKWYTGRVTEVIGQ